MSCSLYDLVDDVMRCAPDAIRVFVEHRMGCVQPPSRRRAQGACLRV